MVQPGTLEKRSLRCRTLLAPKSHTPNWAPVTMWTPERSPMYVSVCSMGAVLTCEKFFHLMGSNQRLSCSSGPCHLGAPMAMCASQCGWRIFGRDTKCCKWIASRFCLLPSKLSLSPVTGLRPTVLHSKYNSMARAKCFIPGTPWSSKETMGVKVILITSGAVSTVSIHFA
ncbi:hypothetical protein Hanom_Chr11g01035471 [Helianthus anomalus]